jgi:hypothetical protein
LQEAGVLQMSREKLHHSHVAGFFRAERWNDMRNG